MAFPFYITKGGENILNGKNYFCLSSFKGVLVTFLRFWTTVPRNKNVSLFEPFLNLLKNVPTLIVFKVTFLKSYLRV